MRFYQTLPWKSSTLMFNSLLAVAAIQSLVLYFLWERSLAKSEQMTNVELAAISARRIQPLLGEDGDFAALRQEVRRLSELTPKASYYLIDANGRVLERFTSGPWENATVAVAPIQAFLSGPVLDTFPIYGTDPGDAQTTTFSVAPVTIRGAPGYLYVTLRSQLQNVLFSTFFQGGLIRSGLAVVLCSLLVCIFVALYTLSFLTRRFSKMAKVVIDFGRGDFHERLAVRGKDDIDEMAIAINEMADSLAGHIDELKRKDELRRELIENVSHDLRGPVAVIDSHVQALQARADSADRSENFLEKVRETCSTLQRSLQSLSTLLSQLFELGRLEAREREPEKQPFSLTELLHDIELGFLPLAEAKGLTLRLQIPDEDVVVDGDVPMLGRVFQNLIDNAMRFTAEGGTIELRMIPGAGQVKVEVADTGIGIPPSDISHVFERTYQTESAEHAGAKGLGGLGLAIVRQIILLHGGAVGVESTVGEGSTFYFTLPLHGARTGAPQAPAGSGLKNL